MANNNTLYTSVVNVGKEYLGPAGERFVRRQVETHLEIEPEQITQKHIPELVKWSKLAFAMLTDDVEHIDAFENELLMLADRAKNRRAHAERS